MSCVYGGKILKNAESEKKTVMIELVFKYYILQFIQTNLSSRSRRTPKSLRVNLKSLRRTPNNMFLLREIGLF